jgi:hypothetical protein
MDFAVKFSHMYIMGFDHIHPIFLSPFPPLPGVSFQKGRWHIVISCVTFYIAISTLKNIMSISSGNMYSFSYVF